MVVSSCFWVDVLSIKFINFNSHFSAYLREAAYASGYSIEVSSDSSTWETVATMTGGHGLMDTISLDGSSGRYIRLKLYQRGTGWAYSLYEVVVQEFVDSRRRLEERGTNSAGLASQRRNLQGAVSMCLVLVKRESTSPDPILPLLHSLHSVPTPQPEHDLDGELKYDWAVKWVANSCLQWRSYQG